jgi:hypothetical protein
MINRIQRRKLLSLIDEREDGCWEWNGQKNKLSGHGVFLGMNIYRLIYSIYKDKEITDIPSDMIIQHYCDNPFCVNPKHLYSCYPPKNRFFGKRVKGNKLHVEEVVKIKQAIAQGYSNRFIAREFGLDHSAVSHIRSGKDWKYVKIEGAEDDS